MPPRSPLVIRSPPPLAIGTGLERVGITPQRPGSGRGAARRRPSPGLIGLDHAASADWLSRHGAEPVRVVEEPLLILAS